MGMLLRQLLVASLLSLALISLFGSLTPKAGPLDYCKADAARLCPAAEGAHAIACLKEH